MFVDAALGLRLERLDALFAERIAAAFAAADPGSGAGSLRRAGAVAAWVAPGSVLSRVHALGLDGPPEDADLDAIEEFYRSHGEASVRIELSPFAGVPLMARLEQRGYRIAGLEQVQVRRLGAADRAPAPAPAGVTIAAVDPADPAARAAWARVSGEAFFAPASPPPDLVRYGELCFDVFDTVAWLASVDGVPAATGAHSLADGICALFAGATLPAARGRGCHGALIAARLAAGAAAGAEFATVGAAPGGPSHRHLHAAGFETAYTRPLFTRSLE